METAGCRWCDYDSPPSMSHEWAMLRLVDHAKVEHPEEYAAAVRRSSLPTADVKE